MNKITYIEARDKIWNAYFNDEIRPCELGYCFCGTLNGGSTWRYGDPNYYTLIEYAYMEAALFSKMKDADYRETACVWSNSRGMRSPIYTEDELFNGMLAALEVLKNIHRERGDFIPEDEPLLTKRILAEGKRGVR